MSAPECSVRYRAYRLGFPLVGPSKTEFNDPGSVDRCYVGPRELTSAGFLDQRRRAQGIESARHAERLRPVHAHLAPGIDREGDAHFSKRRIHQVGAMLRAFDPARHRILVFHLPGSDVFADRAVSVARALDTLRRI